MNKPAYLRPQVARTPEGPPAVPVPLRGGALARVRYRPGRARGAPRRSILVGGDPEPVAVGVPDLDLPRPRGLFHLRDYDDQGTPTHDHASTPRDQDRASVRGTAQRTPLTRW